MNIRPLAVTLALTVSGGISFNVAEAAPVLDGSGFGSASAIVTFDPNAPTSNFGAPGPTTSGAAYDIYTRADSTYAYVLVGQSGGGGSAAGLFANLYFGTGATATSGSDVAFEVTNSNVFNPNVGVMISTAGTGIEYAALNNNTEIEFAAPLSYFETDPQNVGFTTTNASDPDIILRLSQSFGYSVAGGSTYGTDRLGLIVDPTVVPEPISAALFGVGLLGLGLVRRQRQTKH
jgi:PEP-CTERM motif